MQRLSPASAQAVASGISSRAKLRGDVSCYNWFLICRQEGKNDLICRGMLAEKEMSVAHKGNHVKCHLSLQPEGVPAQRVHQTEGV